MKIADLAYALISAATKGSNVASIIRSEDTLLELLTEEKIGDQKNERFVQDFKTLADVLIQEMVRHDLDQKFPGLGDNLFGEESSKFTNAIGEMIDVQIKPSQEENYELLCQVLHGNTDAAQLLAKALNTHPEPPPDPKLDQITEEIELSQIRLWIDPIDSTAQYIHGHKSKPDEHGIVQEGLECVTVLIGVYLIDTGLPIAGVVFQPFHHRGEGDSWKSRCLWGVCYGDIKMHSDIAENALSSDREHNLIITSSSEDKNVQKKLEEEFRLCYAAGAGYKTLCVLDNTVDAYLLSKGSTYHWDICAPHAILLAMGGGIVTYKTALENPSADITQLQIHYNLAKEADESSGIDQWCNSEGVIAYRDISVLKKVCSTIS